MKKFYFVGGPKLDQSKEFFRCPGLVGEMSSAWCIDPRTPSDGKDSSIAKFEPQGVGWNRLLHFECLRVESDCGNRRENAVSLAPWGPGRHTRFQLKAALAKQGLAKERD